MRVWIRFVFIFLLVADAQAQVYLITGSYNQAWNSRTGSVLAYVSKDGKVSNKATLVSQEDGFSWIRISYELKRAVVAIASQSVRFLSLDTAEVIKTCKVPSVGIEIGYWLAGVPALGPTLEVLYQGKDVARDPQKLIAINANPALSCGGSVRPLPLQQVRSIASLGSAGVGDFVVQDGFDVVADPMGNLSRRMGPGNMVALGLKLPEAIADPDKRRVFVYASNPTVLVVGLSGGTQAQYQSMVLRKNIGTWIVIPEETSPRGLRAFGKYVAITEGHLKKAISAQLKAHPGMINIDTEVMEQERSAGPIESGLVESFANSTYVFPGRLHVFDSSSGTVFTITTDQGDSEILLVDYATVYYRVSNRLYAVPISPSGLGPNRLIATDETIRDAHWAFTIK